MALGDLPLPYPFGAYELLARLGRGGMGQVYLARRRALGGSENLCVLKTLRADLAEDAEYLGRFLDEVRTVMQLRHSGISHVFDADDVEGEVFMAMEYLRGVTLKDVFVELALGNRLPPGLALLLLSDVLDALHYAHRYAHPLTGASLGVVHRDVSPHNVMVTFEGEVKLIDFGLAESVLKQEDTESHLVMGKVGYMAPEQARGEEVGPAADQFAAAVVLYELLAGERFYGARNNADVWRVVGVGGFRPDGMDRLPDDVRAVLERALAPRPEDRFESCATFRQSLEEIHVRRFPDATRSKLRALLRDAFSGEEAAQRQQVRQSLAAASEPVEMTVSASASASLPAPPSASHTATEAVARTAPEGEGTAGVVAEGLPRPSRWPLAVGAAVVVVGIGAAWVTTQRAEEETPKEVAAARAALSEETAAAAEEVLPEEVQEEELHAEEVVGEEAPFVEERRKVGEREKPRRPPAPRQPRREAPPPVEVDEPVPSEAVPPVAEEVTPSAALESVMGCKKPCARILQRLVAQRGEAHLLQAKNPAALLRCARSCSP